MGAWGLLLFLPFVCLNKFSDLEEIVFILANERELAASVTKCCLSAHVSTAVGYGVMKGTLAWPVADTDGKYGGDGTGSSFN